jgi:predicted nucleic acid-binding protein
VTRVTLDSNVYLSGFVFGGKPKRVLEMAIDGEIEVAVSDPIIQEVRRHLLGKFGWSEPRAADAIESIAEFAKRACNKTPTSTRLGWASRLLRRPEALQSLERVTHTSARSDACPGRIDKHCAT